MTDALVVLTTAPSEEVAVQLAEGMVKEGLAACVHILPQGRSFYLWEGVLNRDAEWTLILKTQRERYAQLEERLRTVHPYDTPEILALGVEKGSEKYLAWLTSTLEQPAWK